MYSIVDFFNEDHPVDIEGVVTYNHKGSMESNHVAVLRDRQSDLHYSFIRDMTEAYASLKEQYRSEGNKVLISLNHKKLSEIIRKRMGLKVKFSAMSHGYCDISISDVFGLNPNSPIMSNGNVKVNAGSMKRVEGEVDLDKGIVTGDFRDIESTIYIGVELLKGDMLTDEEVIAVLLHELGHCFVSFYNLQSNHRYNEALQRIIKDLDRTSEFKERKKILIEESVHYQSKISEGELESMAKKDNRKAVLEWLAKTQPRIRDESTIGMTKPDKGTFLNERLADHFVNRFGMGVQLVTALEKINRHSGYNYYHTNMGRKILNESILFCHMLGFTYVNSLLLPSKDTTGVLSIWGKFSNLLSIYSLGFMSAGLAKFILPFMLYKSIINTVTFYCCRYRNEGMSDIQKELFSGSYAITHERFTSIRSDLIRRLKLEKDGTDISNKLLSDIQKIDGVIEMIYSKKYSSVRAFMSVQHDDFKLENMLEELANNKLFVDHVRFKQLFNKGN